MNHLSIRHLLMLINLRLKWSNRKQRNRKQLENREEMIHYKSFVVVGEVSGHFGALGKIPTGTSEGIDLFIIIFIII